MSGSESDKDARIAELERRLREVERANEILKAASTFFRPGDEPPTATLTKFVDQHREEFSVEKMCEVVEFPVSTYYAAKKRENEPSTRAVRDQELVVHVRRVWSEQGRRLYGAKKVWNELRREGIDMARCTVERLMRDHGMAGVCAERRRPRTTIPGDPSERPRDPVERDFRAPAPNQLWVTDITYVELADGRFCYAAFVTDAFSRAIVGWHVSGNLKTELALDARSAWHARVTPRRPRSTSRLRHGWGAWCSPNGRPRTAPGRRSAARRWCAGAR
ncbi:IS3 family transposase [Amycolatopsis cihanbeyliensis]|uniref:IS3 family transposase n=1 Tax=Amycolatopsis cihanbeyliensis TaxID=1128664 RepID=UPI00114EF045|nr:IS3 family transposase [Amycolatopsis cihanbeyliensis]